MDDREYQLVSDTFRALLPKTPHVPGCDIGAGVLPFTAAGGDFYDFLPLAEGKLGIAIGDVGGKGISAGLLMAATLSSLRAAARVHSDLGELLGFVNELLVESMREVNCFATVLLVQLDILNQSVRWVNAGHCGGWILQADGKVTSLQGDSGGLPLGIVPGSRYAASDPIALKSGDKLFLYTDGVIDLFNQSVDPVIELLRAKPNLRSQDLIDTLTAVTDCLRRRQAQNASETAVPSTSHLEGFESLLQQTTDWYHQRDDLAAVLVKIDGISKPSSEPASPIQ